MCELWLSGVNTTAIARALGRHVHTVKGYLDLFFQKEFIDRPDAFGSLRRTRLLITPDYKEPAQDCGVRATQDGEQYSPAYEALWSFHPDEYKWMPDGYGAVHGALARDRAWGELGFFVWLFDFWPETIFGRRKGTTFWRDDVLNGGGSGPSLKCRWPGASLWRELKKRDMNQSEAIPLLRVLDDCQVLRIVQNGSHVQALELCERGFHGPDKKARSALSYGSPIHLQGGRISPEQIAAALARGSEPQT